jgi:hypothetical protein
VDNKSTPGWCVVLKKEARGRWITSTEEEYGLGQEVGANDFELQPEMETGSRGVGHNSAGGEAQFQPRSGFRRSRSEMA